MILLNLRILLALWECSLAGVLNVLDNITLGTSFVLFIVARFGELSTLSSYLHNLKKCVHKITDILILMILSLQTLILFRIALPSQTF